MVVPSNNDANEHWMGAICQQVYLLIFTLAALRENDPVFALHDYSLSSTMIWHESDFKPFLG
jgi:hypothetical protein